MEKEEIMKYLDAISSPLVNRVRQILKQWVPDQEKNILTEVGERPIKIINSPCVTCGKETNHMNFKYFMIPYHTIVDNKYLTCNIHSRDFYTFEDFYNPDGTFSQEKAEERLYRWVKYGLQNEKM